MKWIIKPNKWYDQVEEPWRMLYMIAMMLFCYLIGYIVSLMLNRTDLWTMIGILLFGFLGLYRVSYHMIMDSRRYKTATSLNSG